MKNSLRNTICFVGVLLFGPSISRCLIPEAVSRVFQCFCGPMVFLDQTRELDALIQSSKQERIFEEILRIKIQCHFLDLLYMEEKGIGQKDTNIHFNQEMEKIRPRYVKYLGEDLFEAIISEEVSDYWRKINTSFEHFLIDLYQKSPESKEKQTSELIKEFRPIILSQMCKDISKREAHLQAYLSKCYHL